MLVLERKVNQGIFLVFRDRPSIRIVLTDIVNDSRVKIGVEADKETVSILRDELIGPPRRNAS